MTQDDIGRIFAMAQDAATESWNGVDAATVVLVCLLRGESLDPPAWVARFEADSAMGRATGFVVWGDGEAGPSMYGEWITDPKKVHPSA